MQTPRQAAVTAVSGRFAETLDDTFTSFAQNPFLELHAFVIGEELPSRRLPGIDYHLIAPDPGFGHPMRDLYYRRLLFLDQLAVEYAVLVDNHDVLCLRPIPELPALLRGAALGACVEHAGSRYLEGQGYTSTYLNAGVTFWHLPSSRRIREDTVARGRACFRSVEDQLTLNEVVHTRYYDDLVVLPSQYNYRAYLAPARAPGWPTVTSLDGVRIYHNETCALAAKKLLPVAAQAVLRDLPPDERPLSPRERFWRRLRHRLARHWVR